MGLSALPASAAPISEAAVAPAAAPSTQATLSQTVIPINQVIAGVGTLTGTFTPTQFVNQNGQLGLQGIFQGSLTTVSGTVIPITQTVTSLIGNLTPSGSCKILTLDLGPLHLDLLGLVVDLSAVHLNITAQSGNGNLLGNLLCSVAGLLDNNGGVNGLANLLNQLLGL
ncbi:MAG: ABC transporter substrate-binding protein [Actinobacteria bacterium]|nr:ABC transporter substrate-binding protein [Actinomycetota bacterium]